MNTVLQAEGIRVRVGAKTLLHDVSLSVQAGERVALVGPNGAGKTTLMRTLSGELQPAAGRVKLKDRDIASYAAADLALHRAVLSQSISVAFPFTVAEIIAMGAINRHGERVAALVESALAEVDLAGFSDRLITTLSGGEQQRAHFARVLVQLAVGEESKGAGVLLLDEPTASLDLRHQLYVLNGTQRYARKGVAVVAVLHDLNLAALFADRIVVVYNGRIAAEGTPQQTINDDTLHRVFGIDNAVNRIPAAGMPFVLPHSVALNATTA